MSSLRVNILLAVISTLLFLFCCYLIYYQSEWLSVSEQRVSVFIVLMGAALFASPIFLVRVTRIWLRGERS